MLQIRNLFISILLVNVLGFVSQFVLAETSTQAGLTIQNLCPQGYYGANCKDKCNASCSQCDSMGKCLHCSKLGFQPPECVRACNRGFFGSNCKRHCDDSCLNAECDSKTGYCLACRDAGYSLPTCTLPCLPGTYGLHCKGQCPLPCKESCDRLTGICTQCDVGEGPHCTVNCALAENKENCSEHCPEKCVGWCNTAHRKCSMCSPGYKAPHCREYCDRGTFGSQCKQNCSFRCKQERCDHVTGECMGCNDGFVGRWCNGKCVQGLYGPDCAMACPETCLNKFCDAETGYCVKCLIGYTGHLCDRLCESGSHGPGCSTSCPTKCRWPCDPVTGDCPECMVGYKGKTCNSTCPTGSYGLNCNRTCPIGCLGENCHHETGDCVECRKHFHGPKCTQFVRNVSHPFEIVVYSVLSLLTPVVFLGIMMACYRYRSVKENKTIMEKVVEADAKISRPMQRKEQRSRINKNEIHLLGNLTQVGNQNIESLSTEDREYQQTLQVKSSNFYPVGGSRKQPSERPPTSVTTSAENSKALQYAHYESSDSKMSETNTVNCKPAKPPRSNGSSVSPIPGLSDQDQMSSSKSRKFGKPVSMNYSTESRLGIVPKEEEKVIGRKTANQVNIPEMVRSADISRPFLETPVSSLIDHDFKTGADSLQAPWQDEKILQQQLNRHQQRQQKQHHYHHQLQHEQLKPQRQQLPYQQQQQQRQQQQTNHQQQQLHYQQQQIQQQKHQQQDSIARNNSVGQHLSNVERPMSNSRFGSDNGGVGSKDYFAASPLAQLSQTKLDQQNSERFLSVSPHASKSKPSRVASSPSNFNVAQLPILPKNMSSSQIAMLSYPQSDLKRQRTQSSSPQARLDEKPFLQSVPQTKPFASSPQSLPPLNQEVTPRVQSTQSAGADTQPPLIGSEPVSLTVPPEQSRSISQTDHGSISQNKMTSLQQKVSRSRSVLSAETQAAHKSQGIASPPRPNTSEAKLPFPIQQQNTSQTQLPSGTYNKPHPPLPRLSAFKHLSQSEHTMPSSLAPSILPTLPNTLSQQGKPLSREQYVASRPMSSSSLRLNNTLSSLPTIPMASESWSGQQCSSSNFRPQGKSSTLTNITSNDSSESGQNKHLKSNSASGLPATPDIEESETVQPGLKEAIASGSNSFQPTNFTFRCTSRKDSGSQESAPYLATDEPNDLRCPQLTESLTENTQEIPPTAADDEKLGNSSRRKTKQVSKSSGETKTQKRPQSKSPGLVRCATTRRQAQNVAIENKDESTLNPLPTPPAQGRAILKPVHKLHASKQRAEPSANSKPSSARDSESD